MGGVAGDVNAFSTVDIEIQFQPIVGNLTHHCWEGNKNLKLNLCDTEPLFKSYP